MSYHDDAAACAGAARAAERAYQASLDLAADQAEAAAESDEDRWLADLDTFGDWLSHHTPSTAECIKHCAHTNVPRDEVSRQFYIDTLDPSQLLTLALQHPCYAPAAMVRLADLYIAYRRA